jgi:hypothetical protein
MARMFRPGNGEGVIVSVANEGAINEWPKNCSATCALHHCRSRARQPMKAEDRAKLPLCALWNGSNKISL